MDHARPPTLSVSELFTSVQGEGPSLGIPCTFLRLSGCNLRCVWCDTRYAWDFARFDRQEVATSMNVTTVAERILEQGQGRLVVTGGEPLLQQAGVEALVQVLPAELGIEVETNGTLAPSRALALRVDQWNVSPKLGNSGEPVERRIREEAIRALADTERAWLKLVAMVPEDLEEADELAGKWGWPRERIVLMPCADTAEALHAMGPWLVDAAIQRGWRYSTRLQVELWEGRRGV